MSACGAIGSLEVGGRAVAAVVCDLDEGHGFFGVRHHAAFEWLDADVLELPDADLFDPDEELVAVMQEPERLACEMCRWERGFGAREPIAHTCGK